MTIHRENLLDCVVFRTTYLISDLKTVGSSVENDEGINVLDYLLRLEQKLLSTSNM